MSEFICNKDDQTNDECLYMLKRTDDCIRADDGNQLTARPGQLIISLIVFIGADCTTWLADHELA